MHQTKMPHLVTLSRSEGSVALGVEMLRGVYPECNEWAQHDSMVPHYANEPNTPDNWAILRTIFPLPHRILLGGY